MGEENREVAEPEGADDDTSQQSFIEICLAIAKKALDRHTPPEKP